MIKNYFVLDLSNLTADAADKFFFQHLHLDSKKSHFEILTTIPEQITSRLKKYNLKASLEMTAMYIDQASSNYYANSIDKAYFRGFNYISFFNKQNKSLAFVPSQIEVPARVYYSKRLDQAGNHHSSVFSIVNQKVKFKRSLDTDDKFAGVPFFGTFFPVLQLTSVSNKIAQMFENLEHSDLVGLMVVQSITQKVSRAVLVPENKTLCLQGVLKGSYAVNKKNQIHKISFIHAFGIKASRSLFQRPKKTEGILKEVYS